MNNNNVLYLPLKKKWFDMIISDIKKRNEMIENGAYRRFRVDLMKIDSDSKGEGAFTVDVKAMIRDMQFANVEKVNEENTII